VAGLRPDLVEITAPGFTPGVFFAPPERAMWEAEARRLLISLFLIVN
jgi:hypothetical protein